MDSDSITYIKILIITMGNINITESVELAGFYIVKRKYFPRWLIFAFHTEVLVLLVGRRVSNFTFVDTLWCVSLLTLTGGSAAIHMMLAWRNTVGATTCRQRDGKLKN